MATETHYIQHTPPRHQDALDPRDPNLIVRYNTAERLTHWAVAISYIMLFLSGLAMFHPFFWWTSALFGGGTMMRILHPFIGVALAVLFCAYALRLLAVNRMEKVDWEWVHTMFAYMNKERHSDPETGKYNAGQKLMFWSMIAFVAALLVSGILIWQPYFAPAFSRGVRKGAAVVHVVSAFVMFVGIGIHIYAAYWTKGSMRAMTRGTVTRAWARFHHPGWYRQVTGGKDVR
jgi:formate dehydrogenase subunit gamma